MGKFSLGWQKTCDKACTAEAGCVGIDLFGVDSCGALSYTASQRMETIVSVALGISLAAACGFRVFVPLLVLGLMGRCADVPLTDVLAWTSTTVGLVCLGCATLVETLGYYIPWVDNALDAVSTPLALVAGTLMMGGQMEALPDVMQWGVAIVAGAGTAGVVQAGTATVRATSTATTGGLGNFIVATLENIMAVVGSVLAVILPVLAVIGLVIMAIPVYLFIRRLRRRKAVAA